MLMRPHQQMVSLLLLSAFGCQTESVTVPPNVTSPPASRQIATTTPTANFRLKKMVVNGNNGGFGPLFVTTHFDYLQERTLKQAIIPPTSVNAPELTNEYSYDQQGRLDSYRVRYGQPNGDGSVGELNTFTFRDNTVEQSFARLRADGQKMPSLESNARDIYRTNAEGQITEWIQEGIIRYGQLTRARYVYTYENGNILKATYLDANDRVEFTLNYQYDDKQNPFYGWMYTFNPVLRSSRNNVVSVQVNNGTPSKTEYTYNADGLPLTKKDVTNGAVLTYEYEPF